MSSYKFGETRTLSVMFDCRLQSGSVAKMPILPDLNQTDVKWVKLNNLKQSIPKLYPEISKYIIDYAENRKTIEIIEEHTI